MRPAVRWFLRIVVVLLIIAAAGVGYLFIAYPSVPPAENVQVAITPERVARGAYLFDHVAICVACHSTRDFSRVAGPVVRGTEGKGGEAFTREMGMPGTIHARNITPAAIGDWTDGEIVRALAAGVDKHGDALFPLMPYLNYGAMDREDIEAIVAYMRTLPPIVNHVAARELDFPMPLVIRTLPRPAAFATRPPASDRVAYGGYLTRMASCADCHTPAVRGEPVPGMDFAGGTELKTARGGIIRPANLTPDADTGLGTWTEAQFIERFKAFETAPDLVLPESERRDNTFMPWRDYAGMTREDLAAIYAYLRTRTPVVNRVPKPQLHR
jgi:mono/diheme cytochrome c family protein